MPAARAHRIFKLIDRNGDGKLSIEELSNRPAETWLLKMDQDGDERLSLAEFEKGHPYLIANGRSKRVFAAYDLNGDGFLDMGEFVNRPPEVVFIMLDENGDGKLSLTQFAAGTANPGDMPAAKKLFEQKDANHDGFLSLREYLYDPADARFWRSTGMETVTSVSRNSRRRKRTRKSERRLAERRRPSRRWT